MLKAKATVEQIVRETVDFLSHYIKVERAILFGSYLYDNAREDSDFDIAIISEDLEEMDILAKMELFSKAAIAVDSRVELKGFGRKEFLNPGKGSLLEMIKEQGKVLDKAGRK